MDDTITPWLESMSRVIGTVMMRPMSSGRTIIEAPKHGKTPPVMMNIPPSFLKAYLTEQEIASIWSESSGTGPSRSSTAKCGSGRGKTIPVEIITGPRVEPMILMIVPITIFLSINLAMSMVVKAPMR